MRDNERAENKLKAIKENIKPLRLLYYLPGDDWDSYSVSVSNFLLTAEVAPVIKTSIVITAYDIDMLLARLDKAIDFLYELNKPNA